MVTGASVKPAARFEQLSEELAGVGRRFYQRGWVLGTSGNFSAVIATRPLEICITPSAVHKGTLDPADFLHLDARGRVRAPKGGKPSAEMLVHFEIIGLRNAGAVLHTHSVWSTIISLGHRDARGVAIEGYEMLKGLDGVHTHAHREWIPIVDNDQDMTALAGRVKDTLATETAAHAFLIAGHGLYTWGRTVADAERHVEILEFLFEVEGRRERHGGRQDS